MMKKPAKDGNAGQIVNALTEVNVLSNPRYLNDRIKDMQSEWGREKAKGARSYLEGLLRASREEGYTITYQDLVKLLEEL